MSKKCKCGKDAVLMSPEGKKVCVTCYKIYINKEKLYGRRTST